MRKYGMLGLMVAVSTVLMLGVSYLNVERPDHIYLSESRIYMAFMMGAIMAVVMLTFMRGMYPNRRANAVIYLGAVIVFAGSLWLVRSQRTVSDVSWMMGMIPHHSIAILTSDRAQLKDPRVRALAHNIAETQRREIGEMKALLDSLGWKNRLEH